MRLNSLIILMFSFIIFSNSCTSLFNLEKSMEDIITVKIDEFNSNSRNEELGQAIPARAMIKDYKIDYTRKEIIIIFNKYLSFQNYREKDVKNIRELFRDYLGNNLDDYNLIIKTGNLSIEELIPNYYRNQIEIDSSRIFKSSLLSNPIVSNIDKPFIPKLGLHNRNIALWHSHGFYYNHKHDRWMFQRARLFQMIEDLGPMAFTIPYIIPMLENAGANVFIPRERDVQLNEVIVDNREINISTTKNSWFLVEGTGYGNIDYPLEGNENPFIGGDYIYSISDTSESTSVSYIPNIPEHGEYSVYISYQSVENSSSAVLYTVNHLGGTTEYIVNQSVGGGTWIYLGKFKFDKGESVNSGSVKVTNKSSESGKIVTSDVIRFGGGFGVVARNGKTSGRPKYLEGARYWMQFSGVNDSLVYSLNGDTLDYNDDYQSRGEWVNYLVGTPLGPNLNKNTKGLGIPIDLSVAFHTDAGVSTSDTTIGTLSIYSSTGLDSAANFPTGVSRLANRDFTDIMQTQIVEDIREKYDPIWRKREIRDARYSEAARPNVPSTLLELLSHQNYLDNVFQSDPRFRFDVSRAIYKSIVKFIGYQNNIIPVVQPLPVTHFSTRFLNMNSIQLSWNAKLDPLEDSASPHSYIVYTKIDNGGFDNGVLVHDTNYVLENLMEDKIYSFKVTAINDGGESFPSEVLSTGISSVNKNQKILIINAFDRICGPMRVDEPNFKGFLSKYDAGVPDKFDISFIGYQHNYQPGSPWNTDDMPGHGASYGDYENKLIVGNTFDFPSLHGESILNAGYSFTSTSDEAVWDGNHKLQNYSLIDIIFGEEKETDWPKQYSNDKYGRQFKTFPRKFREKLSEYLLNNGNIFLSGSYIGSDNYLNNDKNSEEIRFLTNILKFKLNTNHAVIGNSIYSVESPILEKDTSLKFNNILSNSIYQVEAPDAIGPINGSKSFLRFQENDTSAGIYYKDNYGVVAISVPFETILGAKERDALMNKIIGYLME